MALWNLNGKSVLIVDDFPQMRSMLRSMIQSYGAKVIHQAANGEEAIDMIAAHRFDIIFCDYNLGEGKDGQQVLEEAKFRNLLPYATIFVMVTAENTNNMVMGAVEYQPDAYLAKPINKTVLVSRLEKLMQKKESLAGLSDLLEKKDYETAIAECDRLLASDIKFRLEILKLKSELCFKVDDYDKVLQICNSVLEVREIPWAMLDIGKVHFARAEYDQAQEMFQRIIGLNNTFVSAYDWLARTMEARGNTKESQEALQQAIVQSPKSLLRQRALAEISLKNEDYLVSEKARKQVVHIGKTSCLRQPSDYTRLAKVLVINNSPKDALKVLDSTRFVFKGSNEAMLETSVAASQVYKSMGNEAQYRSSLETALELAQKEPELVRGDAAIDLATECLALGKNEEADRFLKAVVREHHENQEVLEKVGQLYKDAGKASEGAKLISAAQDEVVAINNQGVQLMNEGKVEESIQLFSKAAREMPLNRVINLNAAQSIIANMQKGGINRKLLEQAQKHLDVVLEQNQQDEKARKLQAMVRKLASGK